MQASLDFDELYPTLLERKLDDMLPQAEFEVLNFGVTGYGTFQQLALLKEVVLGFEPDAMLWQFHLNDAVDPRVDGADAGWPRCHAGDVVDPDFGSEPDPVTGLVGCDGVVPPAAKFQAHMAPLGITFWDDGAVIAFHGHVADVAPVHEGGGEIDDVVLAHGEQVRRHEL